MEQLKANSLKGVKAVDLARKATGEGRTVQCCYVDIVRLVFVDLGVRANSFTFTSGKMYVRFSKLIERWAEAIDNVIT